MVAGLFETDRRRGVCQSLVQSKPILEPGAEPLTFSKFCLGPHHQPSLPWTWHSRVGTCTVNSELT